jgi:hypothetical protein
MEERASRAARPLFVAALAAPGLTALAYVGIGPGRPWAGFLVALGVLASLPLAAPLVVLTLGSAGRPRRLSFGYGARTLALHLQSSAVAVGALAVSVAMLTGITVMVTSFRGTVIEWLDGTLHAGGGLPATSTWKRCGRLGAFDRRRRHQRQLRSPRPADIERIGFPIRRPAVISANPYPQDCFPASALWRRLFDPRGQDGGDNTRATWRMAIALEPSMRDWAPRSGLLREFRLIPCEAVGRGDNSRSAAPS